MIQRSSTTPTNKNDDDDDDYYYDEKEKEKEKERNEEQEKYYLGIEYWTLFIAQILYTSVQELWLFRYR